MAREDIYHISLADQLSEITIPSVYTGNRTRPLAIRNEDFGLRLPSLALSARVFLLAASLSRAKSTGVTRRKLPICPPRKTLEREIGNGMVE